MRRTPRPIRHRSQALCGLLGSLLAGVLVACGQHHPSSASADPLQNPGALEIKIWNFQSDNWEQKLVTLEGLRSLDPVQSDVLQFSQVMMDNSGQEVRKPVSIHVTPREGHVKAQAEEDAKRLALYANIQDILRWDEAMQVKGLIDLPLNIEYRLDQSTNSSELSYDPQSNSLIFENHPALALEFEYNSGILAHEHFHQLFQKLVLDKKTKAKKLKEHALPHSSQDETEFYNDMYLRALNEGLADFWGYLFSDEPQFVGKSIPAALTDRDVSRAAVAFPNPADFLTQLRSVNGDDDSMQAVYSYGNQIARWLVQFQIRAAQNQARWSRRAVFGRKVLDSVQDLAKFLSQDNCVYKIPPELFPQLLARRFPELSPSFKDWNARWTGTSRVSACR